MGLDWRPLGKPKPGHENRFRQLFRLIGGQEKPKIGFMDKLLGNGPNKEDWIKEWFSIQTPSYEALNAPRVGRDKAADEWLLRQYDEYLQSGETLLFEEFARKYEGFYVIELSEELDGVPMYISMAQDESVFRGQFLNKCEDLIGEDLLHQAWESKLAEDALIYGEKLLEIADRIASDNDLQYLRDQRMPPDDIDGLEGKVHILYSAAKWLIFYGSRGHGYEADF